MGTAPPRHRPAAAPPRASSGPSSAGRRSGGADRRHARRGGEDARFDDLRRRRGAPLLLPMQRDPIHLLLCMLPSPPATAVLLLLPLRCSYSPARASSASRPAPRPTRAAAGRRPDRPFGLWRAPSGSRGRRGWGAPVHSGRCEEAPPSEVAVSPQSRGSTSDSVQLLTASRKRSVAPSQERMRTEPARR